MESLTISATRRQTSSSLLETIDFSASFTKTTSILHKSFSFCELAFGTCTDAHMVLLFIACAIARDVHFCGYSSSRQYIHSGYDGLKLDPSDSSVGRPKCGFSALAYKHSQ